MRTRLANARIRSQSGHRLPAFAAACFLAMSAVLAVPALAQAAASTATFGRAAQIEPPVNAAADPDAGLYGVACPRAGNCAAGGAYQDAAGDYEPMAATQVHGTWQRAVQIRLPADAAAQPYAEINGVACARAGSCVAVGYYDSTTGQDLGFISADSDGRWARAIDPRLPAGAGTESSGLEGVSCPRAGSCEAIGEYNDKAGHEQAMAIAEVRGRWQRATLVRLPADAGANPEAFLTGISCLHVGDCAAVGSYDDSANPDLYVATGVIESAGHWGRASRLRLPRNAVAHDSSIDEVSCAPDGHCSAAGTYDLRHKAYQAMAVTESAGRWRRTVGIPASPHGSIDTSLEGISCPSATLCFAAGGYQTASSNSLALLLTWSHHRWRAATAVRLPAGAGTGAMARSYLDAVGCSTTGYCAGAGDYLDKSGDYQAMVTTRS